MECHLVACEGCLDEAEFMQMIVAGLRSIAGGAAPLRLRRENRLPLGPPGTRMRFFGLRSDRVHHRAPVTFAAIR